MLTSFLVGNVIVYLCFLTFSSFSFSERDLFQNRFLVRCVVTHICREMGLLTGANDVPVVKVFALHSSTSLARYTKNSKKLFRTNSWLTLCFILSKKGIAKFSSLPIPARFSTQVNMYSRYHYLSDTGLNVFLKLPQAFEQPLIFRNRSESKQLRPYLQMINTASDGGVVKSYFLMSIRLD